jgi:hypothetical protein
MTKNISTVVNLADLERSENAKTALLTEAYQADR